MANWLTKLFGGKKEDNQPDNISEERVQENVSQPEEQVEYKEEVTITSEPEVKESDDLETENQNPQEGEEEKNEEEEKTW
ncbi:MAG: hypothetical protein ACLFNO_02095 [Parcubacteria group bacterium]